MPKAEPYLRRVLSFDPQADYYDILANVLIDSERYSEAGNGAGRGIEISRQRRPLLLPCAAALCLYDNKAAEADCAHRAATQQFRRHMESWKISQ